MFKKRKTETENHAKGNFFFLNSLSVFMPWNKHLNYRLILSFSHPLGIDKFRINDERSAYSVCLDKEVLTCVATDVHSQCAVTGKLLAAVWTDLLLLSCMGLKERNTVQQGFNIWEWSSNLCMIHCWWEMSIWAAHTCSFICRHR